MTHRLLLFCGASLLLSLPVPAQQSSLTLSSLPDFLARQEESLQPLNELYGELEDEELPLRNDTGQALTRRNIEDRRQTLSHLLQTIHELAAAPQDLVVATRLLIQTEGLSDDVFDLSQIAYNNNREELGKRLAELQAGMDQQLEQLESYALALAREMQERIKELEKENAVLQRKLKEVSAPASGKSRQPR